MRWLRGLALVIVGGLLPACDCNNKSGNTVDAEPCNPPMPCASGEVCRYDTCVPEPTPCSTNADCPGDSYCVPERMECLPWGVGPGGGSDPACKRDPVPGVFFPQAQCEWLAPPAGDMFPGHVNVLATPMVGTFYKQGEFAVPSIVFTSYNFTDGGGQSCIGTDPTNYYGVIRVIDGRNCSQQATLPVHVIASASVAIADIGLDPTPEIIAARMDGGLVAFTLKATGWEVMWQTTSTFANDLCDWAGPSVHDLDDDGTPEILFYGAVYSATGATIDESIAGTIDAIGVGYIPVAADVDSDGVVDLITGSQIYNWDKTARRWVAKYPLPGVNGHVAVADFGTFPMAAGMDDRGTKDGVAEVAVISGVTPGNAKVFNVHGRQLFTANLVALATVNGVPQIGRGGPPTIADFDGDGRLEFASAGASAYHVFDPDCFGTTPDPMYCKSTRTPADGIAWLQQSQDYSSNTTGSSVFDFDGDGRAEVVYGDECFTRVYDGISGKVLYSRYRTSCTWYENPLVVDTDADFNAEIVSTSNTNCNVTCPLVDNIFDGVQCMDDSDCPVAAPCKREAPADPLGRCRCAQNADCGGDGFVCENPIGGVSAAGKVCRASHPAGTTATGVRVLADTVDRWVNTRSIWNQHAYSVTNIEGTGKVPKTSSWLQNWKQPGLNNFRQNAPGEGVTAGAVPDLTVKRAKINCGPNGPEITAEVCNRGTEPVGVGVPVAIYTKGPPAELRCTAATNERMFPGLCTTATCTWMGATGDGVIVVDDRGNSTGTNLECREDNNALEILVECP